MQPNQEQTPEQIWDELDAAEAGRQPDPVTIETKSPEDESVEPRAAADNAAAGAEETDEAKADRVAGLEASLARMEQRLRQAEGRYGELNSIVRQQMQAAQAVRESGGDAPTAREIADARGSAEKFTKLKADYPDFAEAIEEFVASRQPAQSSVSIESLQTELARQKHEIDMERRKLRVEIQHPGWEDDIKTPLFSGWLDRQEPEIKMLADSNEPAAAIRVLNLFKQAHPRKQGNNPNLEAAAALPGGRRQTPRAKPVEEMSDDEYWRYLDAQESTGSRANR